MLVLLCGESEWGVLLQLPEDAVRSLRCIASSSLSDSAFL